MAKRFTDTEKWRDEWWGSLGNDYRMIWLYLVDSCSIAGIWKKDFRGLNFNCNTTITEIEFLKVFGERVIDKGTFYFIPKYIRFQCPNGLNSNKPAVCSIVRELQLYNLTPIVKELFGNDYLIIKDKDKDRIKEKTKTRKNGFPKALKDQTEVFEYLKNTYQVIEDAKKTVAGKGWRGVDEVDIVGFIKLFISAKAKMDQPPEEIREHFRNWLFLQPVDKLTEYAAEHKRHLK